MSRLVQRLLVIDDNEDDVYFIKRALQKAGIACEVLWLSGGQKAIDFLSGRKVGAASVRSAPPDLVFLDIKMPMVSGFDVLRWLRDHPSALAAPVPIVMLSSSNEVRDHSEAVDLGARDYAVKPAGIPLFERLTATHGITWQRGV